MRYEPSESDCQPRRDPRPDKLYSLRRGNLKAPHWQEVTNSVSRLSSPSPPSLNLRPVPPQDREAPQTLPLQEPARRLRLQLQQSSPPCRPCLL
ncbi:hypothetical protein Scep_003926 [Stephania cephalantha]|uniref:Uncharacterized protein n=1 Tax=Stephania cephalantha TaxID=152367 RepID=A0AAP0KTC3_9MAGN